MSQSKNIFLSEISTKTVAKKTYSLALFLIIGLFMAFGKIGSYLELGCKSAAARLSTHRNALRYEKV